MGLHLFKVLLFFSFSLFSLTNTQEWGGAGAGNRSKKVMQVSAQHRTESVTFVLHKRGVKAEKLTKRNLSSCNT